MLLGTKVMVKYQDIKDDCEGIFVEKWMENGKALEVKRNINDKTNIYRPDIICCIEEKNPNREK